MLVDKWRMELIEIVLSIFTVYLYSIYFNIFFQRRKQSIFVIIGVGILVIWQLDILGIVGKLPLAWNIAVTIGVTLFTVVNIYTGKFWKKCFFAVVFDAIWMLIETLINDLLTIYCVNLANSHIFGSLTSKLLFLIVIIALKKVFTNEELKELPAGHSILLVFVPIGSIYIMNAVFVLAYKAKWKYSEIYSLFSVIILLLINVLIFYIYIKLADDLQVRRMNLVYEQQLELCERHQDETEISMLQMRDVKHNMRNNFVSILAYAEQGECQKIIRFVNDVMEEGKLKTSGTTNTGNIVTDSLVAYWKRTAEIEGIKFYSDLNIPMDMPFKGADLSLILGNLLENAVEGARKAKKRKYIRLKIKYDKNNLLITVENSYVGALIKGKGEELKTTKIDAINHGIGLPSVRRTARRYHGTVSVDDSVPERFLIRVVLYGL
ncbi:MAG TPA: GHKL domain-containing protein [Candidatus Anaerostipes avistercoris]|uniref:GHKL domain-containing protein n=1 Tax=Candidatus Anaerostipes avistercoris TaxID=2838462 RepID=A0A9D2PI38_9FIRM|nr:GHKL domain-containing protein [Candidatus Anaerostipes avistercoris]